MRKVAKFSICQIQSADKRYSICLNLPKYEDIFPTCVDLVAKVTLYFETAKLFEKKFRTQIQLVNATFWKYSLEQAYKNKEERK